MADSNTPSIELSLLAVRNFEDLFRTYHPVIVKAAFNRLSDLSDAEDAAAEVFARAWRRRRDTAHVFTIAWLYSTLRNVVGNQYRGRIRHAKRVEKATKHLDTDANDTITDNALDIRGAVNRLDIPDRELIWMAYWEDLTREEIAQILGCTTATLRVRLYRAHRKLEEILAVAPEPIGEAR